MKIRAKITAIIISITAIIIAISLGIGMVASQRRFMETIELTLVSVSNIASGMLSAEISRLKNETLLLSEQINRADERDVQGLLDEMLSHKHLEYKTLSVLNRDGAIRYSGDLDARPLVRSREGEYGQRAFAGETLITTTTFTPDRQLIMRIWTPINKDSVLVASLPGLYLSEFLSSYRMWQTGNIMVIDGSGVCIAGNKDFFRVLEQHNYIDWGKRDSGYLGMGIAIQNVIANNEGIKRFFMMGEDQLCAYHVINGTDHWSVMVTAPLRESPLSQVRQLLLICVIVCMGLGIIIAIVFANSIAAPYEKMAELQRASEAASESKTKFLATMSHEMRTPLNAIIGISELELQKASLPADIFTNMEKIYSAGVTLLGIINDILDISKIESGKLILVPVIYDVPSMINDVINLNIVRIGSRPIQFRLHIKSDLPAQIKGDELRIKQIFNNLLSNAFKYTDSGYVDWTISHTREGNRIKIISTVEDTGRGIRKDDLNKLFKEDYYQTNLQANYYVEGTGLGLSITNNLVKLMNGSVSVKSEYGRGAAFTVEFYQEQSGNSAIGEDTVTNLTQFRYSAQRRNQNQQILRMDMSYAKVLIVDDVPTNLDVARAMLKPYKITADCVKSGEEAIRLVREENPRYSAIFMDHMMPGMDGIEAARIIRNEINSAYAKTVPIIALTANALLGNDTMFLENGFQAFLAKPIDILRLDNILNIWVRDKEQEKKLKKNSEQAAGQAQGLKLLASAAIPGLNIAEGLARLDNDEESYVEILKSFITHLPEFAETVRQEAAGDIQKYRIAVHGIKGSSRGIGAAELGARAEELEMAAKREDRNFIQENTGAFLTSVENFRAALAGFIGKLDAQNSAGAPEAPDPALPGGLPQGSSLEL